MNWIKNNKFLSGLIGITTFICGLLSFFAIKWSSSHADSKIAFDESYMQVASSESIPLYPSIENRDGKKNALTSHKIGIETLTKSFEKFRLNNLESIQPQAFTDQLKDATDQVVKAFDANKGVLPEDFFLGFEAYRNQLAQTGATGVLLYQLNGMKQVFAALSKANVKELTRIYREPIPEEDNQTYTPTTDSIARYFPFELCIRTNETSLRSFVNSIGSLESNYFVIRSIAIKNQNTSPPKVTDAKFEEHIQAPDKEDLPDDFPSEISFEDASTSDNKNEEIQADTSRILAQVLGDENLDVFIRIDLVLFSPSKELPKP